MSKMRPRSIELTDELRTELVRRAEVEAPNECCGLVSQNPAGEITVWAASNVAEEPETSFLIHPHAQTELLRQIWSCGEDLIGVYHSHPRSGPEPSERDREIARAIEAMRPDDAEPLIWIIVGFLPCPNCEGGFIVRWVPECCGCPVAGDCCGNPDPFGEQVPCETCGGRGTMPRFSVGHLF